MRIEQDVPEQGAARTVRINSFAVRVLNYLTNHVINRIPSYRLRHAWYRRSLGIERRHDT
jgi:hypothetical protein